MPSSSSRTPLLTPPHPPRHLSLRERHAHYRSRTRTFLSSHTQHYTVLALVSLDLLSIAGDILLSLWQCEASSSHTPVLTTTRSVLSLLSLIFSTVFLLELLCSVWAFGGGYFRSRFHCLDACVIIIGFVTDVVLHGVLEEVASLVVVLRLWRVFKIVEELGVAAQEQAEVMRGRIEELEREVRELKGRLGEEV